MSSPARPVIVLPGITASALRDEYPLSPERVWSFPDAASSAFASWTGHFDRIALHPDDLRYEVREPARVVADAALGMPYADLVAELQHELSLRADEPVPVYPFPYDWRQPLETTEDLLATFIEEVIGRTRLLPHYHAAGYGTGRFPAQVNLVGHSMGGVAVAGYLARYGSEQVHRVATLGSPFRGSHEAVLKLATGLAALGPTSSRSREREAVRLMPALYQLLPSYPGAVKAVPGLIPDLFSPDAWQPGLVATLTESHRLHGLDRSDFPAAARRTLSLLLDGARRHRERIEALKLDDSQRWLSIIGLGDRTRIRLHIEQRHGAPWFDLTGADRVNDWKPSGRRTVRTGDGTVPYAGARCSFIPSGEVVGVCADDFGYWEVEDRLLHHAAGLHSLLPRMNLLHRLVASHFLERPIGNIWGRRAPDLAPSADWTPPIPGLTEKDPPRNGRSR